MASLTRVTVPDIGDFDAVDVIEVLVSEGDEITEEQPLIVLESEKATMEVPSPAAGTVKEMSVSVGDKVAKGDLILTLEPGDGGGDDDASSDDEPADKDGTSSDGDEPAQDSGTEDKEPSDEDAEPSDDEKEPSGEAEEPSSDANEKDTAKKKPSTGRSGIVYAGPAARRLARTHGVDLTDVTPTGRRGRITREDVATYAAGQGLDQRSSGSHAAGAGSLAGLPDWPTVDFEAFGEVERQDLSRIARISGPYLSRNWVMIPHVTQFDQADITELEAFRKEINETRAAEAGVKLTMVSLLMKACAVTLRAFPHFNASLDGDQVVVKRYYHLGFAADTPQGLMVPVIRDVDRKGLLDIARDLTELSGAARDGSITREQMQGGTFTISSLGGIGGTAFTPIINAPEVAILGVSRSVMTPVWQNGGFVPRLMLPLSLSYDHRVIDGAAAARFTTHLASVLSDPRQMLL